MLRKLIMAGVAVQSTPVKSLRRNNFADIFRPDDHLGINEELIFKALVGPKDWGYKEIVQEKLEYAGTFFNRTPEIFEKIKNYIAFLKKNGLAVIARPEKMQNKYFYGVTYDPATEQILIPLNVFKDNFLRMIKPQYNIKIIEKISENNLLRNYLAIKVSPGKPLSEAEAFKQLIKLSSSAKDKYVSFILDTLKNLNISNDSNILLELPRMTDKFDDQPCILDYLFYSVYSYYAKYQLDIPLVLCLDETANSTGKFASTKALIAKYIEEYYPKRTNRIVLFDQPFSELSSEYMKTHVDNKIQSVLLVNPENIAYTYELSSLRQIALMAEAYMLVKNEQKRLVFNFLKEPDNPDTKETKNQEIVFTSVETIQEKLSAADSFSISLPQNWGYYIIKDEQSLRTAAYYFGKMLNKYFFQHQSFIKSRFDTAPRYVLLNPAYYANEADVLTKFKGTVRLGEDSRLIVNLDLHIENKGRLEVASRARLKFSGEHGNNYTIANKTTARTEEGDDVLIYLPGTESYRLYMPSGTETFTSEDYDLGTDSTSHNSIIILHSATINRKIFKNLEEALVEIAKHGSILMIDDEDQYLKPTLKFLEKHGPQNLVTHGVSHIKDLLASNEIHVPAVLIIDKDLSGNKKLPAEGITYYPALRTIYAERQIYVIYNTGYMIQETELKEILQNVAHVSFVDKSEDTEETSGSKSQLANALINAAEYLSSLPY